MAQKRHAVVGVGGRSRMYLEAIRERYREHAKLVAICDNNQGRMDLYNRELVAAGCEPVPTYLDSEFDRMVEKEGVERVIVTTRDCFHDKYIVRAMELGIEVVTEKPMTTDAVKCQRIIDTARRTGISPRVTFNYRYSPARTQLKDLLMGGAIGRPLSLDFHWLLDTRHGADYFRRWHRNKANSGGLMVHKATHHFDLVNWWLSACPVEVYAAGHRRFYTPETAERLGLAGRSERCLDCPVSAKCRFFLDLRANDALREMYLEQESYDGYFRDQCVFSERIDIEDSMNLVVKYDTGAIMSFSLNAFLPKEGLEIKFNGTRGRLEHSTLEQSYVSGLDGGKPGETIRKGTETWLIPQFSSPQWQEVWHGTGGHGGGDAPLLDSVFLPEPPEDKYLRAADYIQGAWSILVGIAANISMKEDRPVKTADLVTGLGKPEFPPMPEF
jgi:predicted dehydrogenase